MRHSITRRNPQPIIGKGKAKSLPYSVSCVAWIDLLGYGSMLRDARFDPTDERASQAVERLKIFHNAVSSVATRNFRSMVINDGAISCRDLSFRDKVVAFDFLANLIELHNLVNERDREAGFPGARMIIASGFRMRDTSIVGPRGNAEGRRGYNLELLDNIMRKMQNGTITPEQAVLEAFYSQKISDAVPELQANFAFTKAYLADQSGSKAGFVGANCFIDLALFEEELPEWITFNRVIEWSVDGMSGVFGQLEQFDKIVGEGLRYHGILKTQEIAKRIFTSYNDENVLKRLGR